MNKYLRRNLFSLDLVDIHTVTLLKLRTPLWIFFKNFKNKYIQLY